MCGGVSVGCVGVYVCVGGRGEEGGRTCGRGGVGEGTSCIRCDGKKRTTGIAGERGRGGGR